MKKIFIVSGLILIMLVLLLIGCAKGKNENVSEVLESDTDNENISELDSLGDVEVDKGLFSVEITVPSEYVENKTQEELTALAEENGYKSITLNEDGSATYVMTKSQHNKMMSEMKKTIDSSIQEMIGSEDYPSFTDIQHNDDYTEFTVTTAHASLDLAESFSTMAFYMYGGMYAIFNGSEVDNIHVIFVNSENGEIVSEANSNELNNN